MVLLTFLPGNVSISVPSGTTLLQAMIAAGLSPDAPCGGKGTCGKCRVLVGGETVLACKTIADRDMTVTIPEGEDLKILTAGVSGNLRADGSHPYAAAFDIGTTTVVGFLLDGRTGELLMPAVRIFTSSDSGMETVMSRSAIVLQARTVSPPMRTRHLPQVPLPPQGASRCSPAAIMACSSVVPGWTGTEIFRGRKVT